jgi:hypothetical protein
VWRRERVGRTSVEVVGEAVEAVDEDLAALDEDPTTLGEAAIAEVDVKEQARVAWTWQWLARHRRWTR